jgi:hypothetical protein
MEAAMELRLTLKGASAEEVLRGEEAALACLEKAGLHPLRAADGFWELEGWDINGFPEDGISDEDSRAADAWLEAQEAAIAAASRDWPGERFREGMLELILTPEEKEQYRAAIEDDEPFDEDEEREYAALLAEMDKNT